MITLLVTFVAGFVLGAIALHYLIEKDLPF